MPPKAIPDRWIPYKACGEVIEGTRIICFKVPLKLSVQKNVRQIEKIWDIPTVLADIPRLGAVIDLTNTARYYNPQDFLKANILHRKILMPGRVVPPESSVQEFMNTLDEFLAKNSESLVGVHCTHGLNRTGYMVCRYMRDRMGIPAEEAITKFETARGYKIERDIYRNGILGKPEDTRGDGKEPEVIPVKPRRDDVNYRSPLDNYGDNPNVYGRNRFGNRDNPRVDRFGNTFGPSVDSRNRFGNGDSSNIDSRNRFGNRPTSDMHRFENTDSPSVDSRNRFGNRDSSNNDSQNRFGNRPISDMHQFGNTDSPSVDSRNRFGNRESSNNDSQNRFGNRPISDMHRFGNTDSPSVESRNRFGNRDSSNTDGRNRFGNRPNSDRYSSNRNSNQQNINSDRKTSSSPFFTCYTDRYKNDREFSARSKGDTKRTNRPPMSWRNHGEGSADTRRQTNDNFNRNEDRPRSNDRPRQYGIPRPNDNTRFGDSSTYEIPRFDNGTRSGM